MLHHLPRVFPSFPPHLRERGAPKEGLMVVEALSGAPADLLCVLRQIPLPTVLSFPICSVK